MAWRKAAQHFGSPASKRLAILSSTAFVLVSGLALYLVYQNSRAMVARISDDFNEQQLILARQAASQIDARLRGIALDLGGLQKYLRSEQAAPPVASPQRAVRRAASERGARAAQPSTSSPVVADEGNLPFLAEEALGRSGPAGMRALALVDSAGRPLRTWGASPSSTTLAGMGAACVSPAAPAMRLGPLSSRVVEGRSSLESVLCAPVQGGAILALVDVTQLVGGVTAGIRSGRTGYAWVIDDKGTFLAHADPEFVARNAFAARHERRPYISFSAINTIMKDRMLRGEEGSGSYVSGWHRGVQGEIAKLIAYSPVRSAVVPSGAVWSVAVVAPTAEVGEAVHHIYVRQLFTQGAVLAALVVFAGTAALYQRRLSKALQAHVYRQEEYISSMLQSSMDAIIFVDNENRVQAWNKGAEHIFGFTAEEMVGSSFHPLVPPELDADKELARIQQEVNEKGYMRHYVATRLTKGGHRITIDLSRTLVRDDQGRPLGSVAIIRDITEQVELNQRIYGTEKLASIGTLAAGVAHEINNPLAIILGFADLLLERLPPGSREYEDVKLIEHNANHARKVVQDILGFARVTEGLGDTVDLDASVETVLTISSSTLATRKVRVVRELAGGLPRVRGDPRELQQVVLNLISNAMAAMEPDGGTLTVRTWQDAAGVHFSVEDTGVGIPEQVRPRIFDPFFTTKRFGEGTGLGLSLCYGIVKKYGGKIAFRSVAREESGERPSGTTFTVTMPVAGAEAQGAVA
jgi:two-component system NtrC family sensor kinase